MTDHRVGLTLFGTQDMLAGLKLHAFIDKLRLEERRNRLLDLFNAQI